MASRKKGNDNTTGNLASVAQPKSKPIKKLCFLNSDKTIVDVRNNTATTCSIYHEEPTKAINQKQVPNPNSTVNHSAF